MTQSAGQEAPPSRYIKELQGRGTPGTAVPELVEPVKVAVGGTMREAGVPPMAPRVAAGSLADIPYDNALREPGQAALSRKAADGAWVDVTAAEFAAQVQAVAKGLIMNGLQPGDRLAIMARTTYDWTVLDFAAWAAGLITVPVYPTSSAYQARHILHDSGAVACAVEGVDEARLISAERSRLPYLRQLWQLDTGAVGQLAGDGRDVPTRSSPSAGRGSPRRPSPP